MFSKIFIFLFQLVIPEYILHFLSNILFLFGGQWLSIVINIPLMAYHIEK